MVATVGTSSGEEILLPLCRRCCDEAFSSESWKKLFGTHPKTPGRGNDPRISDACFDGDFQFAEVRLGRNDLPPHRGAILRLKVPVKDLMLSSGECGFCQIVLNLDTNGNLAKGRYKDVQVDMQLFDPTKYSGTWIPFVMQVTLTRELKNRKNQRTWQNARMLVFLPQSEGAKKAQEPSDEGAATPDPMHGLLEEAKQRMQGCEHCHSDCALAHESLLPMRVPDVQALESVGKVKLVESTDGQHGRYVALSYVWGKDPFLRLQTENRETLMDAILFTDLPMFQVDSDLFLPRTIRDAVQVTRALNVRYLWVDSLCILQNSDPDKILQIPHMNAYYRQATAVISASGAIDVHSGFLEVQSTEDDIYARVKTRLVADHPRYGPMSYRCPVYYPSDDGEGSEIYLVDLDPPLYNYSTEPINRRGWTSQEGNLARRLSIFPAAGGIVMRCSKGERVAGHLLGNPFREEAGSLYYELETPEQDDDQENDESLVDEDSGGSSPNEGSEDHGEADDDESREQRMRREDESGSEDQKNEYESSYEGNADGKFEGSVESNYECRTRSNDGFDVKSTHEANENRTHQQEDRRWVFWTPSKEAKQESASNQREGWNESSSKDHVSVNSSHDDEDDDEDDEDDNERDDEHDDEDDERDNEHDDEHDLRHDVGTRTED